MTDEELSSEWLWKSLDHVETAISLTEGEFGRGQGLAYYRVGNEYKSLGLSFGAQKLLLEEILRLRGER